MTLNLTQSRPLFVNNAYLVRQAITFYNPTADAYQPFVGVQATMSVGLFEDELGTIGLAGLTNQPMTAAAGAPGTYFAVFSNVQTASLASLIGDTIYQVVVGGPNAELRVTSPRVVTAPRFVP